MSDIVITPGATNPILFDFVSSSVAVGVGVSGPIEVEAGTTGKPGPAGPEGGTPVIAIEYADWPPVDPQPNTLYLRLAP